MLKGDKPLIEVTLRKYERPSGTKREVARKFLLSIGLLQPGDSRDTIVDIFIVLLKAAKDKKKVSVLDIQKALKGKCVESNIRYHLRRFMDLRLVSRDRGKYFISESFDISFSFKYLFRRYVLDDVLERIEAYVSYLEEN